jgi:hypothetical protein
MHYVVLLAALESIRGGGRMRPDEPWFSDRLLKEAPLKVVARSSFGAVAEADRGAAVVAVVDESESFWSFCMHSLDAAAGVHTWSANCMMSISTAQDEHLMVGRPLALVRIILLVLLPPGILVIVMADNA